MNLAVNLSDPFVEEKFRVTVNIPPDEQGSNNVPIDEQGSSNVPPDEQGSNNIAKLISRELSILVTNRI